MGARRIRRIGPFRPCPACPTTRFPRGFTAIPRPRNGVFFLTNLYSDDTFAKDIAIIKEAAALGYDHAMIGDFKFMKWDLAGQKYIDHVHEFMRVCHENHIQVFAGVAPLGYANELLVRDPNLAEGLPVRKAQFEVGQGLSLEPKEPELQLINGSFAERDRTGSPQGWQIDAGPGVINLDDKMTWEGRPALCMEMPKEGEAPATQVVSAAHAALTPNPVESKAVAPGAAQTIKVQPFHYYHVKAMFKVEGGDMRRSVKIDAIAPDGTVLITRRLHIRNPRNGAFST